MIFCATVRRRLALAVLLLFGFATGNAFGTIVVQNSVPGTPYTGTVIDAVVGGGVDQVGLLITVQFSTFTSTNIAWVADSGTSLEKGSASASGWTLSADVNGTSLGTFGDEDEVIGGSGNDVLDNLGEFWKFEHGSVGGGAILQSITLDGSAANIVFDRPVFNGSLIATPYNPMSPNQGGDSSSPVVGDSGEEGTTDSERGRDFFADNFDSNAEPSLHVTYMNQVGSFGDLFTKVVLDFTNGGTTSGLSPASVGSFQFAIDTDKTTGLVTAVPEPSAVLFGGLVCGVIGLAAGYRRWVSKVCAGKSE